jgi:lipopolysaccharide/colanic/teichoic acid biosynthesis glycosyltransferase
MRPIDVEILKIDNNLCPEPPGTGYIPLWKRVLDVTCILISLPVTLPVFLLVALWIKIVSAGPAFFKQERVGFKGNRFTLFKFRTMKRNVGTDLHEKHVAGLAEADVPMTKLDVIGDPRIIPGGKILRALGIDELPQIFNVLRGEMSLVGPRPCLPCEWEKLRANQRARYNTVPGLTGYWQVNGKNRTTFTRMIELDIFYTKNLSLSLDLWIMLKTVPAILSQVGAKRKRAKSGGKPLVPFVSIRPEAEDLGSLVGSPEREF